MMAGDGPDLNQIGLKAERGLAMQFQREIADMLGRGANTSFPGAQPVSFSRKHFDNLKSQDYYVCEKSDGIRCLLYFTSDTEANEKKEIHYLIDRKNNYYFVPSLHFPLAPIEPSMSIDWQSFHTATLLDGELLYDLENGQKILKFLVFDCLLLDGTLMTQRTLDKRLAYFMDKVYKPYAALRSAFPEDCASMAFTLQKKDFQVSYGTEMMFRETLPELPHGSDGLIFTCKDTPYKFGTDQNILKWKPAHENSVDFKMGLDFPPIAADTRQNGTQDETGEPPWEYDYDAMPTCTLYVSHGNNDDRPYASLFITQDDWARMKDWSIQHNDGLDGQIVECPKDEQGRWRFKCFRTDKTDANYHTIVESVMESIDDGVSEEELIAAAADIRSAWKKRQAETSERERHEKIERERLQRAKAS